MADFGVPVASLFAELGFKIDRGRFDQFRLMIHDLRYELGQTMKDSAKVGSTIGGLVKQLNKISGQFDPKTLQNWRSQLNLAAKAYVNVVNQNSKQLDKLATSAVDSSRSMRLLNQRFVTGEVTLTNYLVRLQLITAELRQLAGQRINLPRPNGGFGGGSGNRASPTPHGGSASPPRASTSILEAMGLGAFLRPMLPTGMGIGGMLGGGYAFKELVQAGREMQAMENKLKAVSLGAKSFNDNLEFVKRTSEELAMDVNEFGSSYASIFQSAKTSQNQKTIQSMFTGFSKYFRALQLTPDQIKGSLRAISQMFAKEKIQAEEFNLRFPTVATL